MRSSGLASLFSREERLTRLRSRAEAAMMDVCYVVEHSTQRGWVGKESREERREEKTRRMREEKRSEKESPRAGKKVERGALVRVREKGPVLASMSIVGRWIRPASPVSALISSSRFS